MPLEAPKKLSLHIKKSRERSMMLKLLPTAHQIPPNWWNVWRLFTSINTEANQTILLGNDVLTEPLISWDHSQPSQFQWSSFKNLRWDCVLKARQISCIQSRCFHYKKQGSQKSQENNNTTEITHSMEGWHNDLDAYQYYEGVQPSWSSGICSCTRHFRRTCISWWVPFTLKKRDIIISELNSRVTKETHKFGIEVPMSIDNSKWLDAKNGDKIWQDAIAK